jgi:hypothetical protein
MQQFFVVEFNAWIRTQDDFYLDNNFDQITPKRLGV